MKEYTKKTLKDVVENSYNYRMVLLAFGRNCSNSSYKGLKRKLEEWCIDTNHFLSGSELAKHLHTIGALNKRESDDVFCVNSTVSRSVLRNRLIKENIIPYACAECCANDVWRGKKLALILDHVNGVRNDNRLNNLRFLCPNCNAVLVTHCKGAKGINAQTHSTSQQKVETKSSHRKTYTPRMTTRKVNRPIYSVLLKEVEKRGYSYVGRLYGVSDNSIRKWIKSYQKMLDK